MSAHITDDDCRERGTVFKLRDDIAAEASLNAAADAIKASYVGDFPPTHQDLKFAPSTPGFIPGFPTPTVYNSGCSRTDLQKIRDEIIAAIDRTQFDETFVVIQLADGSLVEVQEADFDELITGITDKELPGELTVYELRPTRKAVIRQQTTVEEL